MSLQEELKLLQEKSAKYDNLIKKYVEHAQKFNKAAELLAEASAILEDLSREIDPYVKKKEDGAVVVRTKKREMEEYSLDLYAKMQQGTHISVELVENLYGLEYTKAYSIVAKLVRDYPKILKRKEGTQVFYYLQHDVKVEG